MTPALNTAVASRSRCQQDVGDRLERPFEDHGVPWSSFGLTVAKHAVQRPQPFAAVGLFREPLCPQQIAQLRMRTDDAERDTARRQFVMEIVQHARPGQIDIG